MKARPTFVSSLPRDRPASSSIHPLYFQSLVREDGYAIAEVARAISAHITLISGPTALTLPKGVEVVSVTTAQEMAEAVWSRFEAVDICIMAAAVCDFRPKNTAASKIKKGLFSETLELEPRPTSLRSGTTEEIPGADWVRRRDRQSGRKRARETGAKGTGFYCGERCERVRCRDESGAIIGVDGKIERLPELPKSEVAKAIVERAVRLVRRP